MSESEMATTIVLVLEKDSIMTTTTLNQRNNRLMTQTTVSIIPYTALGLKSNVIAKALLMVINKKFANVKGVKHRFIYKVSNAVEILQIDFSSVVPGDLEKIPGEGWVSGAGKLVDYQTLVNLLLANGYQEKQFE